MNTNHFFCKPTAPYSVNLNPTAMLPHHGSASRRPSIHQLVACQGRSCNWHKPPQKHRIRLHWPKSSCIDRCQPVQGTGAHLTWLGYLVSTNYGGGFTNLWPLCVYAFERAVVPVSFYKRGYTTKGWKSGGPRDERLGYRHHSMPFSAGKIRAQKCALVCC